MVFCIFHTNTDSGTDGNRNTTDATHNQDLTETCREQIRDTTLDSSKSSEVSEERFYWFRSRTQYTPFTVAHLRMLRSRFVL